MTQDDLRQFRTRFDRCETVLLADVSTGTVLASDSVVKVPQEQLDEICLRAATVLQLSDDISHAVLNSPIERSIAIRNPAHVPEVLCAVFAPNSDLAGVTDAANGLFATMNGSDA